MGKSASSAAEKHETPTVPPTWEDEPTRVVDSDFANNVALWKDDLAQGLGNSDAAKAAEWADEPTRVVDAESLASGCINEQDTVRPPPPPAAGQVPSVVVADPTESGIRPARVPSFEAPSPPSEERADIRELIADEVAGVPESSLNTPVAEVAQPPVQQPQQTGEASSDRKAWIAVAVLSVFTILAAAGAAAALQYM